MPRRKRREVEVGEWEGDEKADIGSFLLPCDSTHRHLLVVWILIAVAMVSAGS